MIGWTLVRAQVGSAAVRPVSKPFIVNLDILLILHGSIQEDMILEFLEINKGSLKLCFQMFTTIL